MIGEAARTFSHRKNRTENRDEKTTKDLYLLKTIRRIVRIDLTFTRVVENLDEVSLINCPGLHDANKLCSFNLAHSLQTPHSNFFKSLQ